MYIEQLKTEKYNYTTHLILYLLVVVGFGLLMLVNFLSTQDMNTEDLIHQMIEQYGSNVTFL